MASTAPWPGRAWSEWPCVISALLDRPHRIDVEAADRAAQAVGRRFEDVLWAHRLQICHIRLIARPVPHMTPSLPPLFMTSGDLIADRRVELARQYQSAGDLAAAADLFAQALELAPQFAWAWFMLGEVRRKLHDEAGAIEAFRQARANDPVDRLGAGLRLARFGAADPTRGDVGRLCAGAVRSIRADIRERAWRSGLQRAATAVRRRDGGMREDRPRALFRSRARFGLRHGPCRAGVFQTHRRAAWRRSLAEDDRAGGAHRALQPAQCR